MNQQQEKDKSPLAAFLVKRRAQLGMNQMDLAQSSGISSGTIASIESGHSQAPKAETLSKLAEGLKVSYQELDCIVRGVPYQPEEQNAGIAPLRAFEHYLLNHPTMPRMVAETLVDMLRTVIRKYE